MSFSSKIKLAGDTWCQRGNFVRHFDRAIIRKTIELLSFAYF